METRAFSVILVAVALIVPVHAVASGALTQAHTLSSDPASFDGARARPENDLVRTGSLQDKRSPEQIAKDEQVAADARAARAKTGIGNLANGDNNEIKPKPKKVDLMSIPLAQTLFVGGLTGLLIGSLFGPIGLIVGPLLGAGLYYGLKIHAAKKAAAGGEE